MQCDKLPDNSTWETRLKDDGSMELGVFVQVYGELQAQYSVCAIRHDCLIEAVQGDSKTAKSEKCEPKKTKEGK